MHLINFHTHHSNNLENIQIRNVFAQDLGNNKVESYFSTGIHPWHILQINANECLQKIKDSIQHKNLIAIGECGLDRSIAVDFAQQELIFNEQIKIAGEFSKPLIIHCVKAYSDLIRIKKKYKSNLSWIIHGFRGNQAMLNELIRHGFYFSIGEGLLKDKEKQQVLKSIPLNRLFLETDDQDISILTIYSITSLLLGIKLEMLSDSILQNFKNIFGPELIFSK